MRDQLAKLVEEPLWGSTARERSYETADAIIAALPDMVQPLVWREETPGYWFADYPMGRNLDIYRAHPHRGGKGWQAYFDDLRTPVFATADEAKAAANTHYTRRILSAFGITGET